MQHGDVEDDLEELRAVRVRMMRHDAVWLHRIAHVLNEEPLVSTSWPSNNDLGFKMTEDQNDSDSRLEEALRRAHERSSEPMSTPESRQWGEAFMKEARLSAITALRRRVESGDLVSLEDFQARSQLTAEAIDRAVTDGSLIAISDPAGVNYYPIFYVNPRYDRRQLEQVTKRLAGLHPTVKFHFFTSPKFTLDGKTPLEALQAGRLNDVLRAATEYAER